MGGCGLNSSDSGEAPVVGLCENVNETSWLAERPSASQERLCSLEWVC